VEGLGDADELADGLIDADGEREALGETDADGL
jgi:hypothetical protein